MTMTTVTQAPRRHRGFTLTEIMVTLGLLSLITIGVLRFAIQALTTYYYETGRLLVNKDIRDFTNELAANSVASNYFRIFPDFQSRTTAVTDGYSGDFLVLIFADTSTSTGVTITTRLIGYYRDPDNPSDPTSTGPVRTFDTGAPGTAHAITVADGSLDLTTLLNSYAPTSTAKTNPIVIQLAQGLSDGNLFYDYYDRSIMIRGQIIEHGSQGGRAAVNTYNFTVSPRG
jgi:prepilin-type N-terminal cleavage/methylation domain-containing protein